ncbi:hypothetical protein CONLIGDRAFT_339132 [Coniochaeta ligniaria NRRL 30616]|uniref:Uncharacterized protein n=1 Tax=Coniochaeta ligniaria NRRL 30616 TaxID=1408157 RepID=A0A1J7IQP8_9PEZI|nr:hypothetical protein CONLIGDRAFT_339132 [Coniochaeta ligniaria NRRL 30616]
MWNPRGVRALLFGTYVQQLTPCWIEKTDYFVMVPLSRPWEFSTLASSPVEISNSLPRLTWMPIPPAEESKPPLVAAGWIDRNVRVASGRHGGHLRTGQEGNPLANGRSQPGICIASPFLLSNLLAADLRDGRLFAWAEWKIRACSYKAKPSLHARRVPSIELPAWGLARRKQRNTSAGMDAAFGFQPICCAGQVQSGCRQGPTNFTVEDIAHTPCQ